MPIITLTTDFGLKDHFVGSLKGKIISQCQNAVIIDISHGIDLFNIAETAYVVAAAYNSFPKGTVHFIGVDCEKNSENKHIAFSWNGHYFVCADNGIASLLTLKKSPDEIIEISDDFADNFTDTDVLIKAACYLANGGNLNKIGNPLPALKEVNELQPVVATDYSNIKGNIIYIDHFGNCVTNITKNLVLEVSNNRPYEIVFGTKSIKSINQNYSGFVNSRYSLKDYEGEKLALFNEAGFLEIAIYKSNPLTVGTAKTLLGLKYRDVVTINFQ